MTKLEKQIAKQNLNLHQLEINYGVPRTTLIGILNGSRKWQNVTIGKAINLCLALNCKLSDLVENDTQLIEKIKKYEKLK